MNKSEVVQVSLAEYRCGQYQPPAGTVARAIWYVVNALVFDSWWCPWSVMKVSILRFFGAKVGVGVIIKPRVSIKYPWRLSIGSHVWIGEGVRIDNLAHVTIGSNVCLSQEAFLLTGNHDYSDPAFGLMLGEICLEEGVWICAKAVVCPNVKCRRNSVLTVGGVLRGDAAENGIYSGNPAVFARPRNIRTGE